MSSFNIIPVKGTGLNIGVLGYNGAGASIETGLYNVFVSDNNSSSSKMRNFYLGGFTQLQSIYVGNTKVWEWDGLRFARFSVSDQYSEGTNIEYTSPGAYNYTVPEGVYSISAILIGGGAGGWSSSASVLNQDGQDSYLSMNGSNIVVAGGGKRATSANAGSNIGGIVTFGGGASGLAASGAMGGEDPPFYGGGGGGAGFFSGYDALTGANGQNDQWNAQGGQGASISGGVGEIGNTGSNNIGGSGGNYGGGGGGGRDGAGGGGGAMAYLDTYGVTPGDIITIYVGQGGIGTNNSSNTSRSGGTGADGAVKIFTKSFPPILSLFGYSKNKRLLSTIEDGGSFYPVGMTPVETTSGYGLYMRDYKVFFVDNTSNKINSVDAVSEITGYSNLTVSNYRGLDFSTNGLKVFINDINSGFKEYTLSSPWTLNNSNMPVATTYNSIPNYSSITAFKFNYEGSLLFVCENGILKTYSLSSPWNLSTLNNTPINTLNLSTITSYNILYDLDFSIDGTQLIVVGEDTSANSDRRIIELNMQTPWDITTMYSFARVVDVSSFLTNGSTGGVYGPTGLAVKSNNSELIIIDYASNEIVKLTMKN